MRTVEELLGLLKAGRASDVKIERNRNGGVGADFAKAQASAAWVAANPWVARSAGICMSVTTSESQALIAAGASEPSPDDH